MYVQPKQRQNQVVFQQNYMNLGNQNNHQGQNKTHHQQVQNNIQINQQQIYGQVPKVQNVQYIQNNTGKPQMLQQAIQYVQPGQNVQKLQQVQVAQNIQGVQIPLNNQVYIQQNVNTQNQPTYIMGPDGKIRQTIQRNVHNPQLLATQIGQVKDPKLKSRPDNDPNNKPLSSSHPKLNHPQINEPLVQNQNQGNIIYPQQANKVVTANNQVQINNLRNTAIIKEEINTKHQNDKNTKRTDTSMSINTLAGLNYADYPKNTECSSTTNFKIRGYGSNSYNGTVKINNEDMSKNLVNIEKNVNGVINKINYFGIFDGHGGDKCSKFLRDNMDNYILNSPVLFSNTLHSIKDAFVTAENKFYQLVVQNGKLVDKSGSCALILLILNNMCYIINLGDSRALCSTNSGAKLLQLSRDHKPNDEIEKKRITQAGGKVYYANKVVRNGREEILNEKDYGEGFQFPYRLYPCGLAVSLIF